MAISNRSGKYFVAYKGQDLSKSIIEDKLERKNRSDSFSIKTLTDNDGSVLSNIIYDDYKSDRNRFFDDFFGFTFVSGYNQEEMGNAIRLFCANITDEDRYHTVIPYMNNR